VSTKLGYYPTPAAKFYANQRANKLGPAIAPVAGPWGGYVPDVDPRLVDYRSAIDIYGMVPCGEILVCDYGWVRYDSSATRLPLGVDGDGDPAFGAAATTPLPVLALGRYASQDDTSENFAIVGGEGGEVGYLATFLDGGTGWVAKTHTAGITDTSYAMFDWENYTPGTANATINSGLLIFTNNIDEVFYYPSEVTLAAYDSLPYTGSKTVKCMSVTVFDERLFIFNVQPSGEPRQPLQLTWTIKGWNLAANTIWTLPGSGSMILKELEGEGLRILPLGNFLACYASDGVAVAERTGVVTSPLHLEYLTKGRGLLSMHSVCDIGGGVHFGLFTDGWFFLSHNGQWTEVGTTNKEKTIYRKWADTFYQSVDYGLLHRIHTYYDQSRGFVYISWADRNAMTENPAGATALNNRLWIYDIRGDRIWPDRYEQGFSVNQTPLCIGSFQAKSTPGIQWDDTAQTEVPWTFPGPASWAEGGWQSPWMQFSTAVNAFRMVHGTRNGLVHQHEPLTFTRDGVTPQWYYRVHSDPLGDHTTLKTLDRFWIEYVQTSLPITIGCSVSNSTNPAVTQDRSILTENTFPSAVNTVALSFRFTANLPVFQMFGSHPFILRAMSAQFLPTGALNVTKRV